MSKTVIKIDSRLRDSTYSNSNSFIWQIGRQISCINRFNLCDYYIPNSSYVVNAHNYQFICTYNSVNYTISLTKKNYTATQLATELQTQLNNTVANVFTVTFDSQTNKFSFTSSGLAFVFNFSNYPLAGRLIGFPASATTSGTSLTATNCARIAITPYYFINIPELPTNNIQKAGASTFTINNNYQAGAIASPEGNELINNFYCSSPVSISQLTITLLDADMNPCELNGLDFYIELELYQS